MRLLREGSVVPFARMSDGSLVPAGTIAGKIDGHAPPNESRWTWIDGALRFLAADLYTVTTRFALRADLAILELSGTFELDCGITHYLSDVGPGWNLETSYAAWLPDSGR